MRPLNFTVRSHGCAVPHGKAVCLHCGALKPASLRSCSQCGFAPVTPDDIAKSLVLSQAFEDDHHGRPVARSADELRAFSARITAGETITYDPAELARASAAYTAARAVGPRQLLIDGLKWLAAPLLLLGKVFPVDPKFAHPIRPWVICA